MAQVFKKDGVEYIADGEPRVPVKGEWYIFPCSREGKKITKCSGLATNKYQCLKLVTPLDIIEDINQNRDTKEIKMKVETKTTVCGKDVDSLEKSVLLSYIVKAEEKIADLQLISTRCLYVKKEIESLYSFCEQVAVIIDEK